MNIPSHIRGRRERLNPSTCSLRLTSVGNNSLTLRIDDESNTAAWLEITIERDTLTALLDEFEWCLDDAIIPLEVER